MSSTDTKPDVSALEALDFAVICESRHACGNTATWRYQATASCGCPDRDLFLCDVHKREWEADCQAWRNNWTCFMCHAIISLTWFHWTPLHA